MVEAIRWNKQNILRNRPRFNRSKWTKLILLLVTPSTYVSWENWENCEQYGDPAFQGPQKLEMIWFYLVVTLLPLKFTKTKNKCVVKRWARRLAMESKMEKVNKIYSFDHVIELASGFRNKFTLLMEIMHNNRMGRYSFHGRSEVRPSLTPFDTLSQSTNIRFHSTMGE